MSFFGFRFSSSSWNPKCKFEPLIPGKEKRLSTLELQNENGADITCLQLKCSKSKKQMKNLKFILDFSGDMDAGLC